MPDVQEDEEDDEDGSERDGKIKMVVKRTNEQSWVVSPANAGASDDSPRKQYPQRSRGAAEMEETDGTPSTPEKSPRKRGRPKNVPSTPPSQLKRKHDDANSTIGSESGFADSIHGR